GAQGDEVIHQHADVGLVTTRAPGFTALGRTGAYPGALQALLFQGDAIAERFGTPLTHEYNLLNLLSRPEIDYTGLVEVTGNGAEDPQVAEQVEIKTKYAGYIDRQQDEIARLRASENTRLPDDLDYAAISGLSKEIQHKLGNARPETLGQASRIPGVTPAAISLLLIHLKKRGAGQSLERSA
ncbi:hypothetical protein R0G64_27925, partial [Pseudomonas otitidis]|nr:hypothetical protein [Pseudomonas otitidis]